MHDLVCYLSPLLTKEDELFTDVGHRVLALLYHYYHSEVCQDDLLQGNGNIFASFKQSKEQKSRLTVHIV